LLKNSSSGKDYLTPQYIAVPQNIEARWLAGSNLFGAANAKFFDPKAKCAGVDFQDG
jgi:hypothetical protein